MSRQLLSLSAALALVAVLGSCGTAPEPPARGPAGGGDRSSASAGGLEFPGDFVRIEAESFDMGSPEGEPGRDDDEILHRVTLTRPFWMAATETTQGQWRAIAGTSPSYFSACGDDCPVERVSWYDAVEYANRLSEAEGVEPCYEIRGCSGTFGGGCEPGEDWCRGDFRCREVELLFPECAGYRLPTEGEWEYAARAGTTGSTWGGPFSIEGLNDAPALDPIAWYGGNSRVGYGPAWDCSDWGEKQIEADRCGPHPVATKAPNPWGLHDVIGNVWEWAWDWKGAYPARPVVDPTGPEVGTYRIRRGCSWANIPDHCRSADRSDDPPEVRDARWGFRLVRTR